MDWNSTPLTSIDQTLHDLVSKRAGENPQLPAIVSREGHITYGELDSWTTILAHRLVEMGVRAEVLVGTCFEKSVWATVGMLAILKAGGAFVPIDPQAP